MNSLSEKDSQIAQLDQREFDNQSAINSRLREMETTYTSAMEELKSKRTSEVDSLKEYEQLLVSLKSSLKSEQQRSSALENTSSSVQALIANQKDEIKRIKNEHAQSIESLECNHNDSLSSQKERISILEQQQHKSELKSLVDNHRDMIASLKAEHTCVLETLKTTQSKVMSYADCVYLSKRKKKKHKLFKLVMKK